MKNKYLILIFVLVIISVGTLIWLAIAWSENQEIKKVNISGNKIVNEEDILKSMSSSAINNQNFEIDISKIQKLLKKNPYIQETYITHKNLNEIKVEVKERNPIASMVLENGNLVYIDSSMNLLPYILYDNMPDVPLLNGVFQNGEIDSLAIIGSFAILNLINKDTKQYLLPLISEIDYNKSNNTFSIITSGEGAEIKLGGIHNLDTKINKMDAFYKSSYIASNKSIKYIDLRWDNQILVAN